MGRAGQLIVNVKKVQRYCKRNGLTAAVAAVAERITERKKEKYSYLPPDGIELQRQREEVKKQKNPLFISVVVPAYQTKPEFMRTLLDCMQDQTWSRWELIIAEAGDSGRIKPEVESRKDTRIRYINLGENRGIAENTNRAVSYARGDYIGLLDHDDILTPDALYEMANRLEESLKQGIKPAFLYSDEDKCEESGMQYYAPHRKMDFNLDLLLSNNYICHFLIMETELMKRLGLRSDYDGAQDYDLILRAVDAIWNASGKDATLDKLCIHVSRVLYHWRCHQNSTAANPESKYYAYESGRRALEDFVVTRGWKAAVIHTCYLGFYYVDFGNGLLKNRPDVGAVAGPLPMRGGRLQSGIYDRKIIEKEGVFLEKVSMRYDGLWKGFGGPLHRAALTQDVEAADIRTMQVQTELEAEFQEALFSLRAGEDPVQVSLNFCDMIRNRGFRVLWDPCRKDMYCENYGCDPQL